jgi:chromosome segregation ATPase
LSNHYEKNKLARRISRLVWRDRREVVKLESEAEERNLFLNGLDAEKARLESQVQAESRLRSLSDVLQEVESQCEQAKADLERSAAAAKEEADDQDLKHLAIMSSKDETIDEKNEQIAQLEQELRDLREELAVTLGAKFAAEERVVALETGLEEGARAMELERASSARKDSKLKTSRNRSRTENENRNCQQ